jgi:nucleoside-diphosphate-sugar epimerase
MKILITGADGFIGSNLCNLLLKEHKIIAISRKFNNLDMHKNLSCIQSEMSNYEGLDKIFETHKPDIVIHCAWMGGNSFKDVKEIWQSQNIVYSIDLLKLCSKYKVNHFIGFGTSSEYGDQTNKFDENTFCNPINMYGITKFSLKMIAEDFCQQNNIKFTWIRPVYTYGPKDVETRLMPKVIKTLLNNQDLKLNSCQSVIDYLYIDDFVKAVESIIDNELQGIYIICSNTENKIKSVIDTIKDIIKPQSNIIYDENLPSLGPQYICGSSNKLMSLSSWSPKYNLVEGIMKTIDYHKGLKN